MPLSNAVASAAPLDPGDQAIGPASPAAAIPPPPELVVAMMQARCTHSPAWTRYSTLPLWLVMSLLAVASGCGERQDIRSYRVPKEQAPAASATGQEAAPRRMVVATLLAHDNAWFFKVEGAPEAIAAAKDEIDGFFKTIKAPAEATSLPTWEVPENWNAQPASEFRLATLVIPDHSLELAISQLGGVGEEKEYLLMNVNRWLGQISLPPVKAEELDSRLTTFDADGAKLWLFDTTGKSSGGGMMPPMMGRQPPAAPAATAPPPATAPPAEPEKPITFDVPEGWREVPPRMMVIHVLKVGAGSEEAEVAISAFPSSAPSIADPLSNANRWRGEVLLDEITASELPESIEEVAIGDDKGTLVTALGETKGVIAAMVAKGENVWFLKLHGTRENVERHREALVEWLKTVQIAEGNP